MSERDLTEAEKRAWQAATRHVRRLRGGDEFAHPVPVSQPKRAPKAAPAKQKSSPRTKPTPAPPQNRQNEKRVRRGKQDVSASFDLHGHTQQSAWQALPGFLAREQAKGSRCVIVITGKGKLGEGVLRRNFLHWLELPEARQYVSGYAQAHARHGGGGAWYVFLRQHRAQP